MIYSISQNQEFSQEFRNFVLQISALEISFDVNYLSMKISELLSIDNVLESDIELLEKNLHEYSNSEFAKTLSKIKNNIDFEENSRYDRRRIGYGEYYSRSEATYNLTFLKLYQNLITGIDEVLKDSETSFAGFTYHFSRHKNFLNQILHQIFWADYKHEESGKTALYRSIEKECFQFLVLLLLLKNLKKLKYGRDSIQQKNQR